MPTDSSKFDTSRLLAGVASTDQYSVDDILEEFLLSDQEEDPEAVSSSANPESEEPVPAAQPEAMESQSPSAMADAIAQAVAATVGPETESETTVELEPEVAAEEPPAPEPQHDHSTEAQRSGRSIPDVKTVRDPELQKAPRERKARKNAAQKPPIGAGLMAMVGEAVSALRAVQRADLPSSRTSLRAAEKSSAMLVRISGMMAPLRYIILFLMVMSLAGRRFFWMTLGFLGGSVGVSVALICTLLAMILGWQSILKAVRDVAHLRLTYEPLLLLTTVLSLVDTAIHKDTKTLLPLLTTAWCLSGTESLMISRGNLRALRGVITGRFRKAVRVAENQWEHTDCIGKASASTAGFVRRQEEMDTFHLGWSICSLLILSISIIASAYLTAKTKGNYLSILVTLLTVATPVSLVLCCARPYELLTRALNGAGALAGWSGAKMLSGKKAMFVYDEDLFPKETVGHKGVRVYGNQTPRLLASYAASLVLRADNGLGDVFAKLLREMDGRIYDVSYFQVMDAGLAGRINGVVVAVGTYHFMQLLGAMPPPNAPKNGVYIAINGELAGVFAIRYRVRSGAAGGFLRLARERRLTTLLVTKNFCVNPSFVRKWFKMPVEAVVCPKLETRLALSQPGILAHGVTCGYVLRDGIAPYSRLVAGARRIYRMGLLLTLLSVCLSLFFLIWTAAAIAAGQAVLGGARLLLLQIILFFVLELWARFAVR